MLLAKLFVSRNSFRPALAVRSHSRRFSAGHITLKRSRSSRSPVMKHKKVSVPNKSPVPIYKPSKHNITDYIVNGLIIFGGLSSMFLAPSLYGTERPEVSSYNSALPTPWINPLWDFHDLNQPQTKREDTKTVEGFNYAPLNEPFQVRVLVLRPGDEDQPIECSLVRATLHREPLHSKYPGSFSGVKIRNDPESQSCLPISGSQHEKTTYEAVSYAWGDLTNPMSIQCDGKPKIISLNLYEALHAFRHVYEPRILWVDALCINQNDNLEKTHQVSIMGEIYSGASRVLIWLGCGKEMEKAFGLLMRGQEEELDLIQTLMSAPWFSRVWCVQELVRAADPVVTVGKRKAHWDFFVRQSRSALKMIREQTNVDRYDHLNHAEILDDIRSRYENVQNRRFKQAGRRKSNASAWKAGGASLVELLLLTRNFKATDPRDRIFALVGIASDVREQDVEVFPRYHLPTEVVYRQFAVWYLTRKRNLGIFSFGGDRMLPSEDHVDCLPSWVPDLTRPDAFTPLQKLPHGYNYSKDNSYNVFNYLDEWYTVLQANEVSRLDRLQFFHADVHNPVCVGWRNWRDRPLIRLPPIRISHAGRVLHLKGKYVGKVVHLTANSSHLLADTSIPPEDILDPTQKWLHDYWEIVFSLMHGGGEDRRLNEIFEGAWRAMICDTTMAIERDLGYMADEELGNAFRASFNNFLHKKLKRDVEELKTALNFTRIQERSDGTTATISGTNSVPRETTESWAYHTDFWDRFVESSKKAEPKYSVVEAPSDLSLQPPSGSSAEITTRRKMLLQAVREGIDRNFSHDPARTPEIAAAVVSSFRFWHRGRRFGIADNGGFISAPESAREGDVICMFDGGRVPFVLRPNEDGLYSLVGECYVHGLMHGEWKRPNKRVKFQTISFALK